MTAYALLVPLLLAASATDIYGHRIPNWLTGPAALAGVIIQTAGSGAQGFLIGAAGLFLGLGLLTPFYLAGGMGGGDVKLLGAIGALLGPKAVFLAFLFSAVAGGFYALLVLLAHGYLRATISRYLTMLSLFCFSGKFTYIRPPDMEGMLCLRYGVSIAIGTFLSLWKGSYVL
jgi:prepilin peptidase CpaA